MSDVIPPEEPGLQPVPPPAAALPEPPPQRSGASRIVLMAAIVVAVVFVCGAAAAFFSLRGAPETVLDKVPSTADVVVVAHLDPAASQKMNLFRMSEKFPALGSRADLTQKLNEMLDQALGDSGLSHEDLRWVGGEAGVYVDLGSGDPSYGILLASSDDAAASSAIQKVQASSGTTYTTSQIGGVDVSVPQSSDQPVTAMVQSVVVLASDENAMRSVIDTANGGASIQDDQTYQAIAGDLPQDNLGMAYVNVAAVNQVLEAMSGSIAGLSGNTQQLAAAQAVGMSVSATSEGLSFDVASQNDPSKLTQAERDALATTDGPNGLLSMVPSDAYAVAAMGGVTAQLERSFEQLGQLDPKTARTIEQLDLVGPNGLLQKLSGDVSIEISKGQGFLPIGGTVMVGVKDAGGVEAWLNEHLPKLLAQTDVGDLVWQTEDYNGTTIHYTDPLTTGVPVAWGVTDNALVVGLTTSSVEQAVDLAAGSGSSISTNAGYQAATAQLPGTESVLYVDVQGALSTVQGFMSAEQYQQFLAEGGENLQPITVIAAGSASDEQGSTSTVVVGIP